MAIIKLGFTPGFRGRPHPPALSRRAYYLLSEHDRDSARLLGPDGEELTAIQAIDLMGGPNAVYHEIIISPSAEECESVRSRCPEDSTRAIQECGIRLARAYAKGRSFLLAIHEQDGRFHFHLAVSAPMPKQALGRHGLIQRIWNREMFGDEPRIQDWGAYQRFRGLKSELLTIIRDQKTNETQRRDTIRSAAPGQKNAVAAPFEQKARGLIEARYALEIATLQARYEARGTVGSPRHQAELEQVEHRHTWALRRLESRTWGRLLGAQQERSGLGRAPARGAIGLAHSQVRHAVDRALDDLGVPAPARKGTRIAMTLAAGATQMALCSTLEGERIPSQSRPGLASSGRHWSLGAQTGLVALRQAIPGKDQLPAAEALVSLGQTALRAAQDLATCPPKLVQTLAEGAVDLALITTRNLGKPMPEAVERAFQAAGLVPVAGSGAKLLQRAVEMSNPVGPDSAPGKEMER